MATLEVLCIRKIHNEDHATTQQLHNVTDFSCSTVVCQLQKLKDQESQYGDGRLSILGAVNTDPTFSPYETLTWTKVEAWCKEPRYGKTYRCYLFIEHHFNMKHTISFIHS